MVTFVMLSHESRVESRLRSLDSFPLCATVHIVESTYSGPNPDAEVRARAYDALTLARGGGLVFLEDDIEIRPLFRRHLDLAITADRITAFCAVNERHYPPGTLERDALPVTLAPIPNYDADRGFHGSMAVYVPARVVEYGVEREREFRNEDGGPLEHPVIPPDHLRRKVTGFDFWLKHTARKFGGMYVALPNSVNHVSRHGTWPSLTFHVPEAA